MKRKVGPREAGFERSMRMVVHEPPMPIIVSAEWSAAQMRARRGRESREEAVIRKSQLALHGCGMVVVVMFRELTGKARRGDD